MAASPTRAERPLTLAETPAGDPSIPRLELAPWAERYGLIAGLTTAAGGYSLGPGLPEQWAAFGRAFQPAFPAGVFGRQIHGRVVRWQDGAADSWVIVDGTDGHATARAGMLLTVSVADCTPVYLADPDRGAIALLHAGWRGTAARILEAGIRALVDHAGTNVSSIVIHCGVAICGTCYEVGSEVVEALGGAPVSGKAHVDIRAALVAQADALSVRQVSVSPFCTAHDPGFHSHRASGGRGGRMIAYLGRAP
jgi:purine-nucleoside/S-methyl-5'-thioadenosine phosphorylase / adenosine deaminase